MRSRSPARAGPRAPTAPRAAACVQYGDRRRAAATPPRGHAVAPVGLSGFPARVLRPGPRDVADPDVTVGEPFRLPDRGAGLGLVDRVARGLECRVPMGRDG